MSGFPPPPPPDLRAQRRMWAAQARVARHQARAQRTQARLQARSFRRRSVLGPLLVLAFGVVFLLIQIGRLSWASTLHWYARWWPALLIGAGLIMIAEWALDTALDSHYPYRRGLRSVGGGVAFLLILLVLSGALTRSAVSGWMSQDPLFGDGWENMARALGEERTSDTTLQASLAAGQTLTIRNPRGTVTVTGSSTDGQVHVQAEKQVYAWSGREASRIDDQIDPHFSPEGPGLVLAAARSDGGRVNLTVQTPAATLVQVENGDGDVEVDGIHGTVSASADHGDVTFSDIQGPVTARLRNDNASLAARNVQGPVDVSGRVGDVNLSDISGAVSLQGDFFGETHLERIAGSTRFQSSRTQMQCGSITGELEIDGGPDLQASGVTGPLTLRTSNRNITLDRIQGSVQIQDRNGAVALTSLSPLGPVNIQNQHGSIDVGLPSGAGFTLHAETHNGELENDFSLTPEGPDNQRQLQGAIAGGGPAVTLTTSDGDVTIRQILPSQAVTPIPSRNPSKHSKAAAPALKERTF